MQNKLKSEGKCLFCGKIFAKTGIHRHLATHFKEKVETEQSGKSFLVKVETDKSWEPATPYFISLWIDGEATMKELDTFLRGIWLECCGHMSAFKDFKGCKIGGALSDTMDVFQYLMEGNVKKYREMLEEKTGDIPMSRKVKDVLYKDMVLDYEYDFGSSTELSITVMDEYPVKADKKIVLLSRNEPLKIMCSICGIPATQICTACMFDGSAEFCDKCAKKHAKKCEDFADYASMPIVNSPRMGVCGYTGGNIDKERDGVYQL